ncbi:TPA: hypothetical protein I0F96_RS00515 [Enterococcus faecalis]|nr:hypothetical protein [Enterococcus faecalis]HBI1794078.1 hypothetical protein [Enterococcus faecalis]HBI1800822.1 hypothetical protein [Enterococcus faecalis]HBI1803573.1 hypothetical protein [Enterococcus faecalis]HBI1813451.1 hypothetical protein [Enterococcus faecalis]
MQKITQEASVSRPTVYRYLRKKNFL